ncbi:MAG: hypothetical protein ACRD0K_07215 [Egibacteraceae bacterium]
MVTTDIDIGRLRDLAGRLRGLQEEFDRIDEVVSGYEEAIGSEKVVDRLGRFAANWSDKRWRTSELLQTLAGLAVMAAESYEQEEQAMATAMAPKAAPVAGS